MSINQSRISAAIDLLDNCQRQNPVKSRLIPPEILTKYKKKLSDIEPDVQSVMYDERADTELSAMENQVNRAEKIMKKVPGDPDQPKRLWFQSHKERMEEKERFRLAAAATDQAVTGTVKKAKKKKGDNQKEKDKERKKERNKAKKKAEGSAEERARSELDKVMMLQARLAKKKGKPKTMRHSNEVEASSKAASKAPKKGAKSASAFANDLADTRRTTVKKLRYQPKKPGGYGAAGKKTSGGAGRKSSRGGGGAGRK